MVSLNLNRIRLQEQLRIAEREYACAEYIENTERMFRERSYWSRRIAELKAQLAETEAA